MNLVEDISQFQGIIGAIVGFSLSYFVGRSGKIKFIDRSSWLSTPTEGLEKLQRNDEPISTDYFYQSTKNYTLNLQLMIINTSSVNKVVADMTLNVICKNKASFVDIPLQDLNSYPDGQSAEKHYDSSDQHHTYFNMLSLKPGEAKLFNLISFIDNEFIEENGEISKIFLVYVRPEKLKTKYLHKKIDFGQTLNYYKADNSKFHLSQKG